MRKPRETSKNISFGYNTKLKGYRLYNLKMGKVIIGCNVILLMIQAF